MGGALVERIERPAGKTGADGTAPGFQKWILTNLATISTFSFLLVAVKVFRVSDMETSTALAVITSADPAAVIRGVLIALLPAFLAALIASFLLWRSESIIRQLAFPIRTWVVWALLAVALFIVATVWFVILLVLFLAVAAIIRRRRGAAGPWLTGLRLVSVVSFLVAAYFITTFVLERASLWVPEEKVRFASADLATQRFPVLAYPRENPGSVTIVGYVIRADGDATIMLAESAPGAVRVFVRIPAVPVRRTICLANPPSDSLLSRRPIQVLGQFLRNLPFRVPQLEEGSAARTPYQACFEEAT